MSGPRGRQFQPGGDGRSGHGFPKGVSGNPGGKTKAQHAMDRLVPTLISELTHGGADLVFMLLRIAAGAEPGMEDPKSRAFAIRELLDRALGRPALSLKVSGGPSSEPVPVDERELSDDELRVLAKLDAAIPAKVLQLIPAQAVEAPTDDGDSGAG